MTRRPAMSLLVLGLCAIALGAAPSPRGPAPGVVEVQVMNSAGQPANQALVSFVDVQTWEPYGTIRTNDKGRCTLVVGGFASTTEVRTFQVSAMWQNEGTQTIEWVSTFSGFTAHLTLRTE